MIPSYPSFKTGYLKEEKETRQGHITGCVAGFRSILKIVCRTHLRKLRHRLAVLADFSLHSLWQNLDFSPRICIIWGGGGWDLSPTISWSKAGQLPPDESTVR